MPNEIFEDLSDVKFETFSHKCFTYSFYYLINYIYRNALYGLGNAEAYGLKELSKIFISNYSKVSYIVKKDGILDTLGYTITTTDYPTAYTFSDNVLDFECIKSIKEKSQHSPRLSIKYPVKSFMRFDDEYFTGTYYDFQSTHSLRISSFIKIMSTNKLGHNAFYIYGYLKMMCDRFQNSYIVSNEELMTIVGCNEKTLTKYTKSLEENGLISSSRVIYEGKTLEKIYSISY